MTAAGCKKHLRDTVRAEFEKITSGFVKQAQSGSVPHVKLATEILGGPKKGTRRKKGLMERVLQEIEEKQAKSASGGA